MVWVNLIIAVVSFLATALFAPRPQIENARASSLDDVNFPQATEGAPIPIIFGKNRLRGPNTQWYGNFEAIPITKKQKTGLFSSKRVTIGFEYKLMLNLGLCLGPGVALHEIYIDKDRVYENASGLTTAGATADVNLPELFGGSERGGGFVGQFVYYPGDFTQAADPSLVASLAPEEVPGYVGQAHVVLRGLAQTTTQFFGIGAVVGTTTGAGTTEGANIGEQAQLRQMSFVMSRYPNSLGAATPQIGDDCNPACVIFELLTSDWGGANVPVSQIDVASLTAAATTLAAENNGISIVVSNAQDTSQILQEILRQIDGVMYQDPESGLFTLSLIRDDFVIGDLDVYDESNVVSVKNFSRTSWAETFNQVRVTFTSRDKQYETSSALVQDMANINSQGQVRSSDISFPGVTVGDLANELATRELAQLSTPLVKCRLELKRAGATLRPGDPFILQWDDYGIQQIVMRATRFNLGELVNGKVVLDCLQDVLSISDTLFASPADTLFTEPVREAIAITEPRLIEAPHWVLTHTGQEEIIPPPTVGDSYALAFARRPSSLQLGYSVSLTQDNYSSDANIGIDREVYGFSAILSSPIAATDGLAAGLIPSITIEQILTTGDSLQNHSAGERAQGAGLFFLNDEIFLYETFTDNLNGTFTLNNVRRELLDTAPQAHAVNDILHFLDITYLVASEYDSASQLQARFSSFTDIRDFGFENAADVFLTLQGRFGRPLPPKNATVNAVRGTPSARRPISQNSTITVAWSERSRDETDIIEDIATAGTSEAGQTYEVLIVSEDELTVHQSVTGLTGATADILVDLSVPLGDARILVQSDLNGVKSLVADRIYVTVNEGPGDMTMFSFNQYVIADPTPALNVRSYNHYVIADPQ